MPPRGLCTGDFTPTPTEPLFRRSHAGGVTEYFTGVRVPVIRETPKGFVIEAMVFLLMDVTFLDCCYVDNECKGSVWAALQPTWTLISRMEKSPSPTTTILGSLSRALRLRSISLPSSVPRYIAEPSALNDRAVSDFFRFAVFKILDDRRSFVRCFYIHSEIEIKRTPVSCLGPPELHLPWMLPWQSK